jgi:hypothetical protein
MWVRAWLAGAAMGAAALAVGASARSAAPACGAPTQTVAAVDGGVLHTIYANELHSYEVQVDLGHVEAAAGLVQAVARGDHAAAQAAAGAIIVHPVWHVSHLRVTDARGAVVADAGVPNAVAPVRGTLRLGGRTVGTFLMSVQDAPGVMKLETKVVGNPIGVYRYGALLLANTGGMPPSPPSAATVSLGGSSYEVVRLAIEAFPSGTITVVMLVPASARLRTLACSLVRVAEFARIAARLASIPALIADPRGLAENVRYYTGALAFVRKPGGQLIGVGGPAPSSLPSSGSIRYQSRVWLVASFVLADRQRVYVLVPPAG